MKWTRVLGCLLLLPWCLSARADESDILKKLNTDWINCYVTRNTALLASILDDDIVLTGPSGTKFNKTAILSGLNDSSTTILSDHVDDVTVRFVGDVAIVNARTTYVYEANGKQTTEHNCYMDIYAKRNGSWRCVAAHVSLLEK